MLSEKRTILIVDDQRVNRQILMKNLSSAYEILEAEDGLQGIRMLLEHPEICMILLDLVMPNMNGYEFLEKVKELKKDHIPVVVMTGASEEDTEVRALKAGAIDFITKPIVPELLRSRVNNAVIRNQMVLLDQLRRRSEYDELTGLFNRSRMFSETRRMLQNNPGIRFAFVRFDIDQFRLYNSTMGEKEGDKLLIYIGNVIHRMSKDCHVCTYGRIEADIFCICAPYDEALLKGHVRFILDELSAYRNDYVIDPSLGVYIIDEPAISVETMYTRASMAADQCKNQYTRHLAYYEKRMGERAEEELEIVNEMKWALEEKQFQVYLQPKYSLNTEKPRGAEALVRWLHPKKGLVSPGKFIPVFEKNGFIAALDYYMWEQVCQLLSRWKKEGRDVAPVSVNMSRVSLYNPHVAELMIDLIHRCEIEPELLDLEVTESAYMSNPELMKETIARLQNAGFCILMDDFGSGYSSLNTLKEINIDVLKIDMKFLPDGNQNGRSEKILSSIVRMAGWLGMSVIAEGVETKEQKDFLESIGCGYVQGYYYARPMKVEDYERLMTQSDVSEKKEPEGQEVLNQAVWSSDAQIDQLLSGIPTPLAICEYFSDRIERVRVNRAYREAFDFQPGEYMEQRVSALDNQRIREALEQAKTGEKPGECQYVYTGKGGERRRYRLLVKQVGKISKSCLLCCVFVEIPSNP